MGFIKRFNEWVERLFNGGVDKDEYERRQTREKASELYQVREHGNQLWLTYDGKRVCPINMFENKDAVIILRMLREMYFIDIHGNVKDNDSGDNN